MENNIFNVKQVLLMVMLLSFSGCISGGVLRSGVDHYPVRQAILCDNGDLKVSMDRLRTPIVATGMSDPKRKYLGTYHYLVPRRFTDGNINSKYLVPTDIHSNAICCAGTQFETKYIFNNYEGSSILRIENEASEKVFSIEKKSYSWWHFPYQILLVPALAIDVALSPVYLIMWGYAEGHDGIKK